VSSGFSEEEKERLEDYVVKGMAEAHVPGLSIALVKEGRVVYAKGFGARNLEANTPATPNTLYGIGSCTKSFTAIAVMQLAEQGRLDLQDPAKKYLPLKLGRDEDPIRIHHLLSHSSGAPNDGMAEILIRRTTGAEEFWVPMSSFDDFMLHVNGASEEVAAEPGKRYFYYNSGFALLGEIIERVSGVPYEDYVRERILKPLKMGRSTFLREEFEKDPDTMTAYRKNRDGTLTATVHPFHRLIYAAGGLLSSVTELCNYLTMQMNGGTFEGERLVEASSMEAMHRGYVDTGPGFFGKQRYGYGWQIAEDFLGHRLIQHGGSTGVSSALLGFVPDQKVGVALLANTSPYGSASMTLGALALLMGRDPEKELPFLEIERRLRQLEGAYESYRGIRRLTVVRKGPMLYLEEKTKYVESSLPLIPEDERLESLRFYVYSGVGTKMPVEFTVDSKGRIDMYMERWRLHKIKG
jgi:CubicO group peptidase (beta-lactamase class C family)